MPEPNLGQKVDAFTEATNRVANEMRSRADSAGRRDDDDMRSRMDAMEKKLDALLKHFDDKRDDAPVADRRDRKLLGKSHVHDDGDRRDDSESIEEGNRSADPSETEGLVNDRLSGRDDDDASPHPLASDDSRRDRAARRDIAHWRDDARARADSQAARDRELNEIASAFQSWDRIMTMLGKRATRPLDGETLRTYERRQRRGPAGGPASDQPLSKQPG